MKFTLQFLKIIVAAMLFVLYSNQTYANGIGLSAGVGSENWSNDENYNGNRQVWNLGFVVDTAVRRNKLFGYRFTLQREQNKSSGGRLDMSGLATTHDFDFGLLRNKKYRFWIGPELKLTFYNKLTIDTNEQMVSNNNGYFSQSELGDVWGFMVGPAVGLNVHFPNSYSLAFSAAILGGNYNGDTDYETTSGKKYGDLHADTSGIYLNVAILFRTNE